MLFAFYVAMIGFFGFRAFRYFSAGRAVAGSLAILPCLLFSAGIWVDYERWSAENGHTPQSSASAQVANAPGRNGDNAAAPVIEDYDPSRDYAAETRDEST